MANQLHTVYVIVVTTAVVALLSNAQTLVFDTSEKNQTTSIDTSGVTTERSDENLIITTSHFMNENGDGITSTRPKSDLHHMVQTTPTELSEKFDFNLGDLEDVQSGVEEAIAKHTNASPPSFEEFALEQENIKSKPSSTIELDSRNVYKVAKGKSKVTHTAKVKQPLPAPSPNQQNMETMSNGTFNDFRTLTELYNQEQWNIEAIEKIVNENCSSDMRKYLSGLKDETLWALQASDQSGRYRGQYFYGNEFWVGSALFCEEVNTQRSHLTELEQAEQPEMEFFAATVFVSTPVRRNNHLQVGQCLPISCTTSEVKEILDMDIAMDKLRNSATSNISILSIRTIPGKYEMWQDSRFHLLFAILVVAGILVILATIYEVAISEPTKPNYNLNGNLPATISSNGHLTNGHVKILNGKHLELHQIQTVENNNIAPEATIKIKTDEDGVAVERNENLGLLQKLLLSFGLITNANAILNAKPLSDESVSCIHGMRLFSMMWTIMVHTYLQTFGISENKFSRTITERTFWYQAIGNATYSVDTFFFLSGLLVTLLFLRSEESANKKRPQKTTLQSGFKKTILALLYRYIRLTPAYFTALLCSEISLKYIYNQSVFQPGLTDHEVCPHFWWRNILYIQNWFPFQQLCMIWSWYLANDMQFYMWACILLIISTRFFKTTVAIIVGFLLASWVMAATISLNFGYMLRISEPLESFGILYDKPWTRGGPYIMGMLAGYLIFRCKQPPKISRAFNLSMWAVSLFTMFMVLFGTWKGTLDVISTAIYVSLTHTAWGFALIWITLSCKWGYAKPINTFLSYPGFLPLSRLTYCTYLIHPVTQIVTAFQMQAPLHLQHLMVFTIFLGNSIVSYFVAFILSIMLEAPILRILRIFFKKK